MGWREEEPDQERMREYFEESLKDLEILGPGENEQKRIPVIEVQGIEIVVDPSGSLLVYALKVPLRHSELQNRPALRDLHLYYLPFKQPKAQLSHPAKVS